MKKHCEIYRNSNTGGCDAVSCNGYILTALVSLWIFIVAPLVRGALAAIV